MKKLISTIISISMIAASAAMPVFADYEAPEESYDVEVISNSFDDGTVTNDIDASPAMQLTEQGDILRADGSVFGSEFYLSFDFRFDTQSDGTTVDGYINLNNEKNGKYTNKVGPNFSYGTTKSTGTDLVFRNQTGGSAWAKIADIEPDKWYTAEIEGKTYSTTRMAVYDSAHNKVGETDSLYLRNFASDTKNGNPNVLYGNHVSIDNVRLISENPNSIVITSAADELNVGGNMSFNYTAARDGIEFTKPTVTWSVYDAENSAPVDDNSITISNTGVLTVGAAAQAQTVNVRATAVFGEKEVTGSKQITIKSVDTSGEKFDTITVEGADTVKAGTSSTYTITATKGGLDVTDTLTDEDVVWSVYDYANLDPIYSNVNSQEKVSVTNGVLTISDKTLPQSFIIRASSVSGNIYGSKAVSTTFSDSQTETVIYYDAFEKELANEKSTSVDGSTAMLATSSKAVWDTANQDGYVMTEMDIRFTQEGSGFVLKRRDGGKTNTEITYSGGNIKTNSGVLMTGANTETWYHVELLYSDTYAACNIYTYNENGTRSEAATSLNIDRRNASSYGRLDINSGACVDNIIIYKPTANSISLSASGQYMFAGETMQLTPTLTRNGLPLSGTDGITWTVLDEEDLPIIDGSVTVDSTGLLTVDSISPAQTITVVASAATGASDSVTINIQVAEIFSVTNIGINEAGDKIVKLYVNKNYYYNDDVTFIISIKDENGVLKAIRLINTFGDRLAIGSNELNAELALPTGFDSDTWPVEAMVWTMF